VDLISFSGDKLLGGPQAGIIAGNPDLVARVRRNPLYPRAAAGQAVLPGHGDYAAPHPAGQLDEIPALRMIRMSADAIKERAERLAARIEGAVVEPGESVIGGGSTPDLNLPTWVIALRADERRLRANDPPIIARVEWNATAC
jgi:L-seryl-tRNA(Ser) seleniumtransferase